jgi:lipoate---protein ligase
LVDLSSANLQIIISPAQTVLENLAEDDARTKAAAADGSLTLRLWWGSGPTIVLGRSEKPEQVVDTGACRRLGVEVIHRSSGGGTVLQAPGVLNYSLTAAAAGMPNIRLIFAVGARLLVGALREFGLEAEARGTSDVAIGDRKISGNAMAKRWGGLLLHGTLLLDLDLDLVEACLLHPPREPDYRLGRSHRDFVTTLRRQGLNVTPRAVEGAVVASARRMAAVGEFEDFPQMI